VSIAFTVRERLVVAPDAGLGGLPPAPRAGERAVRKDYDALPGNAPTDWATQWDVGRWGILSAWLGDERAGGAVVAWDTPGLAMLADRSDLAALWDLRVAPARRGQGVGAALFAAAARWAAARGARWLVVETQTVNVAACRFYARHGCVLGAVHRFAYATLPDETQLLWYLPLDG
jgi:GNAT superfamily N-acetyltransferase